VGLADRFVGRCLRGSVLSVKRPGAYSGESAAGISYDGAIAARDRLEQREVRSFEMEHVGALWHLDFHHGSRRVLTGSLQTRRVLTGSLRNKVYKSSRSRRR